MLSPLERATAYFYAWEKRGRGWKVFDFPVDLEPPFEPFFDHIPIEQPLYIDDGKKPTILSSIADFFRGTAINERPAERNLEEEIEAYPLPESPQIRGWRIAIPKGRKIKPEEVDNLLLMLSTTEWQVSFEIIGTADVIRIQFACREPDANIVFSQLKAYFPDCILTAFNYEAGDYEILDFDLMVSAVDFGLSDEFMRPLATVKSFDPDPMAGVFGILEQLQEKERGVVQILFKGTVNSWAESIIRSVVDDNGEAFFIDAPEMVKLAQEKVSNPLFGVTIRIFAQALTEERAENIRNQLGNAMLRISDSGVNSLTALPVWPEHHEHFLYDLALRQSHRLGMLINSRELATFLHLPSASVIASKLETNIRKTKAAPKHTDGQELILGLNEHHGITKKITLGNEGRLRHMHVIGATGTGKSSFLLSAIAQDFNLGNGIAVLDPHGDLIENILPWIPEHRVKDVIVIDPADSEYPVGFNILTAHSEIEKDILSSDLVAVFRRLSTSWGDQMNSVFANAILAFLESNEGGTLMDLRRFLIEKPFRDQFLRSVSDPSIVYYWQKEFPLLKSGSIGPILTRLDTFLRPKLIRNMVAQKKSLDFENILDTQKILLIKLSQGLIGSENSYLLGTFIVAKIQQAAMARQAKAKEARADYFLYIDEFQNFITPSMATILSGARKYHLGLTLAHQDMQQLLKQDTELASSVISNASTRICFRLGDIDAKRMAEGFSSFEAHDLQNLGVGEAIGRIDRPEFDFSLTTIPLTEPQKVLAETKSRAILEASRMSYGTPRNEVETALNVFQGGSDELKPTSASTPTSKRQEIGHEISLELPKAFIDKAPTQHRYLQTLIKKMAESRGYVVLLEQPTPDSKGRVDVSLERNGRRIAIEIQDTTKDDWELRNIEKCLAAGYDLVVECSKEQKAVDRLKKKVEEIFDREELKRILVMTPEEFFLFIDGEIAKEASGETRIKGYRVKTEFNAVPDEEAQRMREAIAKSVFRYGKKKS